MEKTQEVKEILNKNPEYRDMLFRRGYLITSNKKINIDDYPFFGLWKEYNIDEFQIYVHKDQDFYRYFSNNIKAIMLGHAYNPFDMKYQEEELLKDCVDAYKKGDENFFDKISEFTGIHLIVIFDKNRVVFVQDCAGIESCYFGKINEKIYITSHVQLVADICNLDMDEYIKKLVSTKCYNIGNRYLPGNLSSYKELKRLGPNTYLEYKDEKFTINRFFPTKPHDEIENEEVFNKTIDEMVELMHNSCILITKKWKKPAISLSGGVDSKTTLAVANGLYDEFLLYSFQSKEAEIIDSEAAHKICESIRQNHKIYKIESENNEVKDFEQLRKIINHNVGHMMDFPENEVRKIIYFYRKPEFDIEVRSWVSEIARVTYERKYDIRFKGILNERELNIMQTRYFCHPILLRKGDRIYLDFINKIGLDKKMYNYESIDMCFWEIRCGSWEANAVRQLEIGNKITTIYNNRKLMELFLSFNHDERKVSKIHNEITKKANEDIINANISIKNNTHKSKRIIMEKTYFRIRTMFYKSKIKKK